MAGETDEAAEFAEEDPEPEPVSDMGTERKLLEEEEEEEEEDQEKVEEGPPVEGDDKDTTEAEEGTMDALELLMLAPALRM